MDKDNHNFDFQEPDDCQLTGEMLKLYITQLKEFSYLRGRHLLVEQSTAILLTISNCIKWFDNGAEEGFKKYDIAMTTEHDEGDTSCQKVNESDEELLQSCRNPELLRDVAIALSSFADGIRGLQSISTAQYDACRSMFMKCHGCVKRYLSEYSRIRTLINKMKNNVEKYGDYIGLSEMVGECGDDENVIRQNMDDQIEELEKLEKAIVHFKKRMEHLKEYINQAIRTSEELWYRGQHGIYRYTNSYDISSEEASSVLCWVKADRKTTRRYMFTCTLTSDDDIGYKLGYMERFLANPVTLSSTIPLEKQKEDILISVPFNQKADMRRRELMVLIRSGKEQLYKETDYEIEIREGLECVQIRVRKFSFIAVLVISRLTVYRQTVDEQGSTLLPPTDTNVEMTIPPGTVSRSGNVEIQTVPETYILIGDVRKSHRQLLGTSSMVLLGLPKEEMTGPVNVKMYLEHENRNFIHPMVHTDAGWASTACHNSSRAPRSYTLRITPNTDRVVIILTKGETDEEETKSMTEAIFYTLDEDVANIILLQHKDDLCKIYIDCCRIKDTDERTKRAMEQGFGSKPFRFDLYLKESALISIKCSKQLELDIPDDDISTFCQFNYRAELFRPKVIYIKPTESEHRGYVYFLAKAKYVGASELKLGHFEGRHE